MHGDFYVFFVLCPRFLLGLRGLSIQPPELIAAATAAFAHAHISSSEHAQIIRLEYSFSTQAELSFGVQGAKSMFSDFGCHFPGIFN